MPWNHAKAHGGMVEDVDLWNRRFPDCVHSLSKTYKKKSLVENMHAIKENNGVYEVCDQT